MTNSTQILRQIPLKVTILLAPTRHTSRGQLDVYRVRESSSSKLKTVLAHVYALAVWATREALPLDLDRWQQDDLDDFLAYLATERTNQRSGAQGLDSISVRGYVNTLRTLHLLRDTLTDGGLSFNPWEGITAEQVAGADISVCRTKPIPAKQYQPLMRNLWKVIDKIVPDLLTALRRTDELNNSPLLAWWGNVNQHAKSDGTSVAELVLLATSWPTPPSRWLSSTGTYGVPMCTSARTERHLSTGRTHVCPTRFSA